ncbi:hypothetical protein SE18_21595 [Herpetosiphon geysericola]|uniref:Uncharacterized protein n=1 Tax=Herpetosiphon geysericola TaxID=70996 RepID=A0A0P6YGA5_9CHLR|nr:hypothetical protein SE18_21595 [Herpetosiphon geysericola]
MAIDRAPCKSRWVFAASPNPIMIIGQNDYSIFERNRARQRLHEPIGQGWLMAFAWYIARALVGQAIVASHKQGIFCMTRLIGAFA